MKTDTDWATATSTSFPSTSCTVLVAMMNQLYQKSFYFHPVGATASSITHRTCCAAATGESFNPAARRSAFTCSTHNAHTKLFKAFTIIASFTPKR